MRHPHNSGARLFVKSWWRIVAVAMVGALWSADSAHAEHAQIDLKVISPDKTVSAVSDRTPPVGGLNRRPVMTVKVGDPLIFQYFLTNVYPHGVLKNVKVLYYVVRINKVGQKIPPKLPPMKDAGGNDPRVVTRGEVTMNFKPHCRVGARVRFRINRPGVYLVRVESANTQSDHEHFSAIDLKVEPSP